VEVLPEETMVTCPAGTGGGVWVAKLPPREIGWCRVEKHDSSAARCAAANRIIVYGPRVSMTTVRQLPGATDGIGLGLCAPNAVS
jgi:hypothetical protein